MKVIAFFSIVLLSACNTTIDRSESELQDTSFNDIVGTQPKNINDKKKDAAADPTTAPSSVPDSLPIQTTYANKRFRNVSLQRVDESTFIIKGEGQIFEASFGWVIEDGHNELKQGHEMTDAGAPEWGKFNFKVAAVKKNPNSTLHLILYETSAEDGSRQHELPIRLY